jgi:ABC-type dipeptide/oligopeptide/nickel transport system permease component
MYIYVMRRLLLAIPVLLLSSLVVFGLMRIMPDNWLRVSGTAELAQIDQRVCQQLHAIMPPLDTFKAE